MLDLSRTLAVTDCRQLARLWAGSLTPTDAGGPSDASAATGYVATLPRGCCECIGGLAARMRGNLRIEKSFRGRISAEIARA
jgi:hypothetical protein